MRWHKTFIYYSRKDRNSIYLLIILFLTISLLRIYLQQTRSISEEETQKLEFLYLEKLQDAENSRPEFRSNSELNAKMKTNASASASASASANLIRQSEKIWKPQNFDPNTLPDSLWKNFGLSEKQINVILNYRNKGGKFSKKSDLKKIYSISDKTYDRLEPYISIDSVGNPVKSIKKSIVPQTLELNTSTISQLMKEFNMRFEDASALIKYRNQLGGFFSKEQLKELDDMDQTIIDTLRSRAEVDNRFIRLMNINDLDEKAKYHPYIGRGMARLIENYRLQHGDYQAVEDIKKLSIMTDALYSKLRPYLIVD